MTNKYDQNKQNQNTTKTTTAPQKQQQGKPMTAPTQTQKTTGAPHTHSTNDPHHTAKQQTAAKPQFKNK